MGPLFEWEIQADNDGIGDLAAEMAHPGLWSHTVSDHPLMQD
jgi:hypothetical protein